MNDEETIIIFNPDMEDFTVQYDIDGTKNPKPFTIRSLETAKFVPSVAKHIVKHLANHILHKRGAINKNVELTLKRIRKEIEVEIDD